MESAGSTALSSIFSDGSSVVAGGAVDGSADGVDASGSSEGGAIDSVSVCVIAAEGEESGGVLSFASLHPAKVKQRIRDKNSGIVSVARPRHTRKQKRLWVVFTRGLFNLWHIAASCIKYPPQ